MASHRGRRRTRARTAAVALAVAVLATVLAPTAPGQPVRPADHQGTELIWLSRDVPGAATGVSLSPDGALAAYQVLDGDGGSRVRAGAVRDGTPPELDVAGRPVVAAPDLSGVSTVAVAASGRDNETEAALGTDIYVAPVGAPANRVTGLAGDPRYLRPLGCVPPPASTEGHSGDDPASCGPKLSADGTALVAPAQLTVESPAVELAAGGEAPLRDPTGAFRPILDLGIVVVVEGEPAPTVTRTVTVAVTGPEQVDFGDDPASVVGDPGWRVEPAGSAPCRGTVEPGQSCHVGVTLEPPACADENHYATLRLWGTTPAGQTAVGLVATTRCIPESGTSGDRAQLAPTACTGETGLAADSALPLRRWVQDSPLPYHSTGRVEAGQPALLSVEAVYYDSPIAVESPGCAVRLVVPDGAEDACPLDGTVEDTCTAYLEARPAAVAPYVATLSLAGRLERVVVDAGRHVVVAWRDRSGGAFADPERGRVVSVAGPDGPVVSGTDPAVSADGRHVAFTSGSRIDRRHPAGSAQVYLHDTDAGSDGSDEPGRTRLVSLLPNGRAAAGAGEPALSGDAGLVGFTAADPGRPARGAYVRDTGSGRTAAVATTPSGEPSAGEAREVALSGDGRWVAFTSDGGDLGPPVVEGSRAIYLRPLDAAGQPGSTLRVPPYAGEPLEGPPTTAGGPDLTADGAAVGFHTDARLLEDDDGAADAWVLARPATATLTPSSLDFGTLPAGTESPPQGLTVRNDGLGPVTLSPVELPGGYAVTADACSGRTLQAEESCALSVAFAPTVIGNLDGELRLPVSSGAGVDTVLRAALSGTAISDTRTPGSTTLLPGDPDALLADGANPDLSRDGRFVAYESAGYSQGEGSGEDDVVPTGPGAVLVRDQLEGRTERVSAAGIAAALPSISGDGRLVAFLAGDGGDLIVADRGDPDAGGAPTLRTVTGARGDLTYQRTTPCASSGDSTFSAACRPRLSDDGTTLVYPATLHPVPDGFTGSILESGEPVVDIGGAGWNIDMGTSGGGAVVATIRLAFAGPVTDPAEPRISSLGDAEPAFEVSGWTTNCEPAPCQLMQVRFDPPDCPPSSTADPVVHQARLRTQAATPGGRAALSISGLRLCGIASGSIPTAGTAAAAAPAADGCAALPPDVAARPANSDGFRVSLPHLHPGEVRVVTLPIAHPATAESGLFVSFAGAGCSLRLAEPPGTDDACSDGMLLPPGGSCTAYVAYAPAAADAYAGALLRRREFDRNVDRLPITGTAEQHLLVMRRDPTGAGDFAAPGTTSVPVSVVAGRVVDGSGAAVSADGGVVAFSSDGTDLCDRGCTPQVYVRDVAAGTTRLASLLPGDTDPPARGAGQPSLSGDGSRLAFATFTRESGSAGVTTHLAAHDDAAQVYVRDLAARRTVLASASAADADTGGNGDSGQPDLSVDGSTVAFSSLSTDLVDQPVNGERAVYVRYAEPDFGGPGGRFGEIVSLTHEGAVPETGAGFSPATSEDGALTTFASTSVLVPEDTDDLVDVYVRRRHAQLEVSPQPLDLGATPVGVPTAPGTVTVANRGPGPVTVGPPTTAEPFAAGDSDCATLQRAGSCTVTATLTPVAVGAASGLLRIATNQGYVVLPEVDVVVIGTGVAARAELVVSPSRLDFPDGILGIPSAPLPVTVDNAGNVPLTLTRTLTVLERSEYAAPARACTGTLPPGARCVLRVTFTPAGLGLRTGSLAVSADAPDPVTDPDPVTVPLAGTTLQPTLEFSPPVVRPGRVTEVRGTNFPPGVQLPLSWQTAPGGGTAAAGPDGTFAATMVVFSRTLLGARLLDADIPGVAVITSPELLVVPPTGQPPDFVTRD